MKVTEKTGEGEMIWIARRHHKRESKNDVSSWKEEKEQNPRTKEKVARRVKPSDSKLMQIKS
jgi:hypothetical protein